MGARIEALAFFGAKRVKLKRDASEFNPGASLGLIGRCHPSNP